MNDRVIRSRMMDLRMSITSTESALIETPWWRLLSNRKLRRDIKKLEERLEMWRFDYEQLLDAVMSEQEQRKWADPL